MKHSITLLTGAAVVAAALSGLAFSQGAPRSDLDALQDNIKSVVGVVENVANDGAQAAMQAAKYSSVFGIGWLR